MQSPRRLHGIAMRKYGADIDHQILHVARVRSSAIISFSLHWHESKILLVQTIMTNLERPLSNSFEDYPFSFCYTYGVYEYRRVSMGGMHLPEGD